jgi:hypothetical protein
MRCSRSFDMVEHWLSIATKRCLWVTFPAGVVTNALISNVGREWQEGRGGRQEENQEEQAVVSDID